MILFLHENPKIGMMRKIVKGEPPKVSEARVVAEEIWKCITRYESNLLMIDKNTLYCISNAEDVLQRREFSALGHAPTLVGETKIKFTIRFSLKTPGSLLAQLIDEVVLPQYNEKKCIEFSREAWPCGQNYVLYI